MIDSVGSLQYLNYIPNQMLAHWIIIFTATTELATTNYCGCLKQNIWYINNNQTTLN